MTEPRFGPGLTPDDFMIGPHARRRIEQMGIERDEIERAMTLGAGTPSKKHEGAHNFSEPWSNKPRINLGCYPSTSRPGRWYVATVVWTTHELWVKDIEKNTYDDREIRDPKEFGK